MKYLFFAFILFCSMCLKAIPKRGLVAWNTQTILSDTMERNRLLNQCYANGTTDLFVYAAYLLGGSNKPAMQQFIERATCHNIHVWAMDGFRGYFSDWFGRWDYMQFIQSVVDYNDSSLADQRFTGIIGDNEPNDGQNEPLSSFHNDIPDSGLDTTGGGVWQATQALDREHLMRDWVDMAKEAYDSCHAHNLLYAQLMVSWLDDYYGEPVHCTYNGQYKRVMEHIMNWLDDYFIMSYRTTPSAAFQTAKGELDYTQTLPAANRPGVWVMCETHCGVGAKLSYCDSLWKNKKDSVIADISMVESYTTIYPAYVGFCVHDWEGWKALSPASIDSSYSGCVFPAAVDPFPTSSTISIYPNPTSHQICVSHLNEPCHLEMIDMKGDIMHSADVHKDTHYFQFSGAPGIYLIKIRMGGNTEVRKLIIE